MGNLFGKSKSTKASRITQQDEAVLVSYKILKPLEKVLFKTKYFCSLLISIVIMWSVNLWF